MWAALLHLAASLTPPRRWFSASSLLSPVFSDGSVVDFSDDLVPAPTSGTLAGSRRFILEGIFIVLLISGLKSLEDLNTKVWSLRVQLVAEDSPAHSSSMCFIQADFHMLLQL
ncbi:hypothetical protein Taro_040047 [Colocasia esculenta]|uniref:Uncharacterized protein n=1 Tax=Colocasia esculenta TaxID=4460 RepID=A0A843WKM9_COLES|nr:hypothetical protein [Colocasia esculenta]